MFVLGAAFLKMAKDKPEGTDVGYPSCRRAAQEDKNKKRIS